MITCKICGRKFKLNKGKCRTKSFAIHIARMHNLKAVDYVKRYCHKNFKYEKCGWCHRKAVPEVVYENKKIKLKYLQKYLCDNDKCKSKRKEYNPRSYYATKKTYKMSKKEAEEFVKEKSPFHREYFETEEDYLNFQSNVSLEKFQERYGKREGARKYQEYSEQRKYIASEQYFIDKYGKIIGKKKWKENNQSKAITREKMIQKYGKRKGNQKYEDFLDKTLKNFVSQMSIDCLNYIAENCKIKIRHGGNSSEKKIRCEKSTHPVDGFCKRLNIVFEFYGDRWHMNPALYCSEDKNPRNKKAKHIWKEDRIRLNDILPKVNSIFIVWENDWNKNKERILARFQKLLCKLKEGILIRGVYFL